jgi:hypothetical protein
MDRHDLAEHMGRVAGVSLAPFTATISKLRHARMFHPAGLVLRGRAEPMTTSPRWRELSARLEGHVLARLSAALFRKGPLPDVLGCAIRFSADVPDERAREGDQDLLVATIRRPWTMALSPFSTDVDDYLANHYFGVCPFHSAEGVIEWRLSPSEPSPPGADREGRLVAAVAAGRAAFVLAARSYGGLFTLRGAPFEPIVRIALVEVTELDQERLRFDPYRSGRGIAPTGFVHGLRAAAYGASQWARPRHRWL